MFGFEGKLVRQDNTERQQDNNADNVKDDI